MKGAKVTVVEAESRVGGHASTIRVGDCYADLAPHTFHPRKGEITQLVEQVMGTALLKKKQNTQMRLTGKLFDYPLNVPSLLRGLSPFLSMKVLWDFAKANVSGKLRPRPERTFEEWCLKRFGKTLSDLCFLNYSRKVWGRSTAELSADLAQQKLTKLNLKDLLVKLIWSRSDEEPLYAKEFYYPELGIGQLWETVAEQIRALGGEIILKSEVTKIEVNNGKVVSVSTEGAKPSKLAYPFIVSTIPISTLILALAPLVPATVKAAAEGLKFRSLLLLFMVVNRPRVLESQWIYFLDDDFTFNRISDQKTLSDKMTPPGKTVLCVEKNCDAGDELWNAPVEQHFEKAIQELEGAKMLSREDVESYQLSKIKFAYPIFDLTFRSNLDIVMEYISSLNGIITVGRPGLYLNNDMHDSMEMGFMAAAYALNHHDDQDDVRDWYTQISEYKQRKGWERRS
jgi:protoporphyrinogen oxidase